MDIASKNPLSLLPNALQNCFFPMFFHFFVFLSLKLGRNIQFVHQYNQEDFK